MTTVQDTLPMSMLGGTSEDVALWLAGQLGDRYRYDPSVGQGGTWRRRYGRTWVTVDREVPVLAAMSELEHAYWKLVGDDSISTAKLDKLQSRRFLEGYVMSAVRILLARPQDV